MRLLTGAALAFAVWTLPCAAQTSGELAITGAVAHPRTLTLAELKGLPPATAETDFEGKDGPRHATFTGAALLPLLDEAGMTDEPGEHTHLRHVLLARGLDGYAVAVAIGELDPRMEGKGAIVAYAQDGQPTKGLRLVVPGDHHAGRAVRDLVAIEVR
jgi:DMSO/TMAO reductase YedYZ molybdopterin-dependent catalytic subunit